MQIDSLTTYEKVNTDNNFYHTRHTAALKYFLSILMFFHTIVPIGDGA